MPTPTPADPRVIQSYALRSGDRVNNARDIWGVVFSLFLPFLAAGLAWIEAHTSIRFGDSYLQVLQGAFITLGGSVIARVYMRQIAGEDQEAGQEADRAGDVQRELAEADAEIGRLRAALAEGQAVRMSGLPTPEGDTAHG